MSKNLTESAVNTIAAIAGGLAGSGVRTGSYLIIKKVKGEPLEAL